MPSVQTTQVLAHAGFDWLFMDMEHGPIDIASLHAMITATGGTRAAPIVRVPWNEHWLVKPVLDAGAMGIVFPMIHSAAEAEAAARSVRYPPAGDRGFGPFYAPLRFGTSMMEYADPADREILCILLIEHRDAIEDIDAIVAVEGVDACFIAPFDLAMSYGHRDSADHPEVQEGVARAERAILDAGRHLGGLALDNALANDMIARGYRLIVTGFDTLLLQRASADILDGISREP
jgi:4-hydroxy-2-oxoheptanedioate aldolase